MKKIHRLPAVILCAVMLSGCFGSPSAPADTSAESSAGTDTETTPAASETPEAVSASAAALASEDELSGGGNTAPDKPLVIALEGTVGQYTPFRTETEADELINRATGVTLLSRTRSGNTVYNGVTGESEVYGGKKYEYSGIADTVVSRDEEAETSAYTFNLRSDIKFADGEVLDADDVIFSLYMALDNSTDMNSLKTAGIIGAVNYRYNSPIAEDITDEQLAEAYASEGFAELLRDRLYIPVLREQYESVRSLYSDGTGNIYTSTYPDPDDLFIFFYSADSKYEKPEDSDKSTLISDIAEGYGTNYRQFAGRTMGDEHIFDEYAEYAAIEYITAQQSEDGSREDVTDISGITKTGKFSVNITVRGDGRALEEALCSLVIAPLHYYGDENLYDYDADSFGFVRGQAADLYADDLPLTHNGEPMGAGAYTFAEYTSGEMILTANENYYGEAPLTPQLKLTAAGDPAALISDGSADITTAFSTVELYDSIDSANRSLRKIENITLGGQGCGVVELNVKTVNIAGEPFSEESCALRKALATVINSFKAESVESYYDEHGTVIDYPCHEGVVMDTEAEYYTVPYSTNIKGDPIYTDGMTSAERTEALKAACLGFFEAAGYTVYDGAVAEAPEGGRLEFTAEFANPAGSTHPSLGAFTEASEFLSELGITLNVSLISDAGVFYENLTSGLYDVAAFSVTGTLLQCYSGGTYNTVPSEVTELVKETAYVHAEDIPEAFFGIYDKMINEYATEVPMYERTSELLYSALRVDGSSLAADMTASYDWKNEIDRIKLK